MARKVTFAEPSTLTQITAQHAAKVSLIAALPAGATTTVKAHRVVDAEGGARRVIGVETSRTASSAVLRGLFLAGDPQAAAAYYAVPARLRVETNDADQIVLKGTLGPEEVFAIGADGGHQFNADEAQALFEGAVLAVHDTEGDHFQRALIRGDENAWQHPSYEPIYDKDGAKISFLYDLWEKDPLGTLPLLIELLETEGIGETVEDEYFKDALLHDHRDIAIQALKAFVAQKASTGTYALDVLADMPGSNEEIDSFLLSLYQNPDTNIAMRSEILDRLTGNRIDGRIYPPAVEEVRKLLADKTAHEYLRRSVMMVEPELLDTYPTLRAAIVTVSQDDTDPLQSRAKRALEP
jgi:hypothetical protein